MLVVLGQGIKAGAEVGPSPGRVQPISAQDVDGTVRCDLARVFHCFRAWRCVLDGPYSLLLVLRPGSARAVSNACCVVLMDCSQCRWRFVCIDDPHGAVVPLHDRAPVEFLRVGDPLRCEPSLRALDLTTWFIDAWRPFAGAASHALCPWLSMCDTVTQRGDFMDTTLSVRLDAKLKEEAERTLDALGLSISSAVRVFLTQVVAQQAMPFPIKGDAEVIHTPPEITAELIVELLATVRTKLRRMADKEPSARKREELLAVLHELRDLRFAFNPHDKDETDAMFWRVTGYARALREGSGDASR